MPARPRFDPKRPLVAARDFTFMGKSYAKGDPFGPFDPGVVSDRLRARQYESRVVNFGEGTATAEEPAELITMTGPAGGRYTITAPWLEEPEVVRGKVNAEKRLAELRAAGAPLGFIEGGSAVTVEEGEGGGWYVVDAPWLDEPEKVQGREAAEARQRELHDAGEPDSYKGYTLTAGENGWYAITKDGVEADPPVALNVRGEEDARKAVAALRAGETIEGTALPAEWDQAEPLKEGDTALVGDDAGAPLAGKTVVVETIDGENATVATYPDADDNVLTGTVPLASLTPAEAPHDEGAEGEDEQPNGGSDVVGEGGENKEDDVDQKDPNERAEELGNQPNASEIAADEQRAGTEGEGKTPAGSGGDAHAVEDKDDDEGDGTTGTVGP